MAPKGKVFLSLGERMKVIQLNEAGESNRKIAEIFRISHCQVWRILKKKDTIKLQWQKGTNYRQKLVIPRACFYPQLEEKIYQWYVEARKKNVPVSGKLLQEKANSLAIELGCEKFTASNGWLFKFQRRHQIRCISLHGASSEVAEETVDTWLQQVRELYKKYESNNIFNLDETGLLFRCMPNKSLVKVGEQCSGVKQAKERLTVMLCCSATGEKLKPLVIGKSANPRCFRNHANLGVEYEYNKTAWMVRNIFEGWLRRWNNQLATNNRRVVLLLDNCNAHSDLHLSHINLVFLPPNTTARLQPLDAGIIQTMKLSYRKSFLRHIIRMMDQSSSAVEIAKKVSILDAIRWLLSAWDSVSKTTIISCFKHCGIETTESDSVSVETEGQLEDFSSIMPLGLTLGEYVEIDAALQTEDDGRSDDPIPDPEDVQPGYTTAQAIDWAEKIRLYAISAGHPDILDQITVLQYKLKSIQLRNTCKQTSIEQFFKQ